MSCTHDKARQEGTFSLTTYHSLGPCRSPDDGLWASFTQVPDLLLGPQVIGLNFNCRFNPEPPNPELEVLKSRHLQFDGGGSRWLWHRRA